MKNCATENIRNFVLTGHAGAGKTSLADLMLFKAGVVSRLGSVDQKTSVSDFRPEEQERKVSLYAASLNLPWKGHHFFFMDTPGYADFSGEAVAAQRIADTALIVVDAVSGIGTGTMRAWKQAKLNNQPRVIFINGLDKEQADYAKILAALQESYGATVCVPFTIPVGNKDNFSAVHPVLKADAPAAIKEQSAACRGKLLDAVAESDETLMTKYLDGQELTEAEIARGLNNAIIAGTIVPVLCGSVAKDIGVTELMEGIIKLFPNPLVGADIPFVEGQLKRQVATDNAMAFVFKCVADPFIGHLSFFRVYSGVMKGNGDLQNVTTGDKERVGALLYFNGKEQVEAEEAGPGEIVAVAKLKVTRISHTLAAKHSDALFPPIAFPKPTISYAVYAVKTGEEEKIANGIHRMMEEDPTIKYERNSETHESVLSGLGDQHVNTITHRLHHTYKVDARLETPKVPYRETITASGSAMYRHKKQTGGHGQFAEVHLRLEPLHDQDFEFSNEVVGGNIPKNFIPAIEKGVVENKVKGPLSNSKVINFRAVVFDGKYHAVDSSEMAFKIAARGAFRDAMKNSKPILLEPIMKLKIMFPEEYMGDITGDLNTRRGRILGMDREEGTQVVHADVPLAETFSYSTQLRSLTHGRGGFEMVFDRYEPVPSLISKQIQEATAKAHVEEED